MKCVGGVVAAHYGTHNFVGATAFTVCQHFKQFEFAAEVVKHQQVFVHNIMYVGRVILGLFAILYVNVFKVANRIERGVPIQATIGTVVALDAEHLDKVVKGVRHAVTVGNVYLMLRFVGVEHDGPAVAHAERGQRLKSDKRTVVFTAMIV